MNYEIQQLNKHPPTTYLPCSKALCLTLWSSLQD